MKPDLSCEITLAPTFHDLDPMNIVWHGNYVKYLEVARCALLSRFDYDYPQMHESGYVWPIVDMRLKYIRPAEFRQNLMGRFAAMDASKNLIVDIFAIGIDSFRMVNEWLKGEKIIDIRFSLFQSHFSRV